MHLFGIIPARAGFTRPSRHRARTAGDHPRSRGVYYGQPQYGAGRGGSSPLARGLRDEKRRVDLRQGIIPARAGFTSSLMMVSLPSRDHPRSRGVYCGRSGGIELVLGSSPLARGLLRKKDFPFKTVVDHPRSRGVYSRIEMPLIFTLGSSPLARGLRVRGRREQTPWRIIPARAGFTWAGLRSGRRHGDHPRSRGVYSSHSLASAGVLGSSPLARGLPFVRSSVSAASGIIPARAGFTSLSVRTNRVPPDHPRSRGVYHVGDV